MKKIYSLLLMATMLLVSGNVWALVPVGGIVEPGQDGVVVEVLSAKAPVRKIVTEETDPVYVAQIVDGDSYETLQEAINAATAGDVIKLLADVIDDLAKAYNYRVFLNKNVTIDMDGHKIVGNYAYGAILGSACVATVKNGEIYNNWSSSKYNCFAVFTQNAANLTLENMVVYGKKWAIFANAGCQININGSLSKVSTNTPKSTAIYASNNNATVSTIINVNGGEVYGEDGADAFTLYGNVAGYTGVDTRDSYPVRLNVKNAKVHGTYGVTLWGKGTEINVCDGAEVYADKYFAICGNGSHNESESNSGTTINIYGGKVGSNTTTEAIYHPQAGNLTIQGGTLEAKNTVVEMRAGNITVNGGTFTSYATYEAVKENGSGSTTYGTAIGISQHTTKLPINATINGGEFKAYTPFKQVNPEKNSAEDIAKISLAINGGKFLCTNGGQNVIYSENFKNFVSDGKFSHTPSVYVVEGKAAIDNTDDDKVTYPYAIGIVENPAQFDNTASTWHWEVKENWSTDELPTPATPVTIATEQNVIIGDGVNKVVATTNGLTLGGTATITVKKGSTLIVDAGGINTNASTEAQPIIVEDGGILAINPAAPVVRTTPKVKVALVSEAYKFDETKTGRVYNDYVWQDVAIPVKGVCGVDYTFSWPNSVIFYLNKWTGSGWTDVSALSQFSGNFQGFAFTNQLSKDAADKTFYFEGELVGVEDLTLTPNRLGFNFFGNSFLAPIDIKQLLLDRKSGFEASVSIYNPKTEKYEQVTLSQLENGTAKYKEIKPMQGFFMFASSNDAEGTLSYTNAVWNVLNEAKRGTGSVSAPSRIQRVSAPRSELTHTAMMNIKMEAAEDADFYDYVSLYESASYLDTKDTDYDVTQQVSGGWNVNIFAVSTFGSMTEYSQKNIENTYLGYTTGSEFTEFKLTFSNVIGEYYLLDHVTGEYTAIVEGATYTFTDNAKSGTTEINNRFQIVVAPAYDVTIGATGWATYCDDAVLGLPAGLQAYKAAYNAAGEELLLTGVLAINANEGVILKGAEGGYNFTAGIATDFSGNELVGTVDGEATPAGEVYCLHTQGGVTGFYKYVGASIPAHKAYFILPAATPAPSRVRVRIVSATTGVEEVSELPVFDKYIENGNLYLQSNDCVVNAQGQVVK